MQVNPLKIVANRAKRIGRGIGSGKGGHTVGYGQKGQGSRGKRKVSPMNEGGNIPQYRKLPHQQGFKSLDAKPETVSISWLNKRTKDGQVVDKAFLVSENVIKTPSDRAKIVGKDAVAHKITVKGIATSVGAKAAIEKAGGKVIN